MEAAAERVVIGMDPHKRSVTIEVMAADETVLGGGRFATDLLPLIDWARHGPVHTDALGHGVHPHGHGGPTHSRGC